MGQKKETFFMSYLNSATIVGFVGADPEQRQARNNGSKFTVLSVATQRSWKNAEDEWVSKVEWHRVAIMWNLRRMQDVLAAGQLLTRKPISITMCS
jgi:Single-strand binding protein family